MRGFEIHVWLAFYWVAVSMEKRTLALAEGGCFEEYAEVYQETYLRAEPVVTHVSVTQSCGIFGWGRCRVQRRITKTRHVTATRLATRLRKRCCENWTGEHCDQNLITSTVSSSPSTTPTSTMTRSPPIIVTMSKIPGTSSEHSSTSFIKPTKVLKPTQDLWPSTGTESTPGLSEQTTARGTPGTNSTVKAPVTPTFRPTPLLTPMPTVLRPSPTGLRPSPWPEPTPSSTTTTTPTPMPPRTAEPTPSPQTPRTPSPTKGPGPQPTPWIPTRTAGPMPSIGPGEPTPMPTPVQQTPTKGPGPQPTPWIPPSTPTPKPIPTPTPESTPTPKPHTAEPRPGTDVTPSPSTVTARPKPSDKTPSSWTDVPTRYVPDQGSGVTHFNVSVTSSASTSLQTSPTTSATTREEQYTTTTHDARGELTTEGDKGHLTSPSLWAAVTTAGESDGVTPTLISLSQDVSISFLTRNISEELLCEFDFHRPFDSKTCELKWLRHGQRISKISSRFIENFYSGKGRTRFLNVLKISQLNRTDVGEYVCVASTETASSNVSVEIRELLVSEPIGTNQPFHIDNLAAIATITGLALLFVVTVVVLPWVVYRKRFIIKLRAKRYFGKYEDTDNKLYDVFVSYCPDSVDERFVVRTLVPKLEQTFNMRVCVDYKEFLPGEVLSVSVIEAVESSRRTILVLSPRFIENGWCRFHFLSAQLEMLQSKHSIIPLIYEDISKISSTDKDLRNILKIAKPVRWPSERRPRTENNFWDHLHLLLPKKRKPSSGFRVNFSRWVFASNKVDYVSTDLSYDTSRPKSRSERSNGVISPADFTDLKLHIEDIV